MAVYYNEIDPFAAQWLRNLIAGGHIAPGDVDERSIEDVRPDDLRGYEQCHFFAGIGGWSRALRLAGWPDDRRVWTGSCPCQPFSAAGKGHGFADQRHLWPAWFHLIQQCRPAIVLGEQVASPAGLQWLDLVHADLEGAGYAVGAADLCAAGVGAPHIRQRLWFVGVEHAPPAWFGPPFDPSVARGAAGGRGDGLVADTDHTGSQGRDIGGDGPGQRPAGAGGMEGGMADAERFGREVVVQHGGSERSAGAEREADVTGGNGTPVRAGALHGHWRDADWLLCRDGRWRPVEPGTQPLAHGVPGRVGLLRGYGNAIIPPVAAAFIQAVMQEVES